MKIDIKRETAKIMVKALLAVTDQLIIIGSVTEAATLREIAGDLDEQIRIDELVDPGDCICPSCNRER